MATIPHDAAELAFLNRLPEDIEYTGEFGPELVLALPFFTWLSQAGLLRSRRIVTYKGMRVFYEDLDCREIVEKDGKREYIHPRKRPAFLPRKNEHSFDGHGRSNLHVWPDLRARFQKFPLLPDICVDGRPLLIVHNKYCNEWNRGPINFMSVELLRSIFQSLSPHFTIVYIRHGMKPVEGYVEDENQLMELDDRPLIEQSDNVWLFDDLYDEHKRRGGDQDLNTFKNVLYSRCHHFISSQGGGAHQIALYSGSLMTVLHRKGSEEKWAYSEGYYNFMARVPPILAVARNDQDILSALPLYVGTTVLDDRTYLAFGAAAILEQLSPKRMVPPPASET